MNPQDLTSHGFTVAPAWANQVGDLGHWFVVAGALLFLASAVLMGFRRTKAGAWTFVAGAVCIFGAFACLASLFLNDQFQFQYVAEHSWKEIAAPYKFAAMWSGQQGSFLLWAMT